MTLKIDIPPETEAMLIERATAEGKDPAGFVLQMITDELRDHGAAVSDDSNGESSSAGQRIAELRAWASSRPALPREADDSRESIYEGRGE